MVFAALFLGIKAAVLAIVVAAVWRIGQKALNAPWKWAVAAGAFGGIFLGSVPFPAVVAGAAVIGWVASRRRSEFGDRRSDCSDCVRSRGRGLFRRARHQQRSDRGAGHPDRS